jgi:hypothetical protein
MSDLAMLDPRPSRFIDGYTIRTLTLKGLILQDTAPPLDEISRFNAAGQAEADDMNVRTGALLQAHRDPSAMLFVCVWCCALRTGAANHVQQVAHVTACCKLRLTRMLQFPGAEILPDSDGGTIALVSLKLALIYTLNTF